MDIFNKNKEYFNSNLGVGITYDIAFREIEILNNRIGIYYLNGLVDNEQIILLIQSYYAIPKNKTFSFDLIYNNTAHEEVNIIDNIDTAIDKVLNGIIIILIEESNSFISVDVRKFNTRSIAEPETEKVIRGSHEGFVENLNTNISLIRRRIKDGRLRNIIYKIGSKSPIDVCVSYIEGLCDQKLLNDLDKRMKKIKIDHLIMTDKQLEELLLKQKLNPYPLVRYTERPDTVSVHLYQGMFAITVDTSPSVILAPATFFDHLQHTEEYRQTPLAGTYLRLLRFIGVNMAIFLTPIWYLLYLNNSLDNTFLDVTSNQMLPIFIQLIIAEIGVEFLRMASIHTPSALSTSMGLIAGVLIGNIAIDIGLFSIQVVLLVALSAIGTYITPSYELGLANKITKLIFLIGIFIFKNIGFVILFIIWILFLCSLKSFSKPYLSPFIPFKKENILKTMFRLPYKNK